MKELKSELVPEDRLMTLVEKTLLDGVMKLMEEHAGDYYSTEELFTKPEWKMMIAAMEKYGNLRAHETDAAWRKEQEKWQAEHAKIKASHEVHNLGILQGLNQLKQDITTMLDQVDRKDYEIPKLQRINHEVAHALNVLVGLKDYKDTHGKNGYYNVAQKTAWDTARYALVHYNAFQEELSRTYSIQKDVQLDIFQAEQLKEQYNFPLEIDREKLKKQNMRSYSTVEDLKQSEGMNEAWKEKMKGEESFKGLFHQHGPVKGEKSLDEMWKGLKQVAKEKGVVIGIDISRGGKDTEVRAMILGTRDRMNENYWHVRTVQTDTQEYEDLLSQGWFVIKEADTKPSIY